MFYRDLIKVTKKNFRSLRHRSTKICRRILDLLVSNPDGLSLKEISNHLGVTQGTIIFHVKGIERNKKFFGGRLSEQVVLEKGKLKPLTSSRSTNTEFLNSIKNNILAEPEAKKYE